MSKPVDEVAAGVPRGSGISARSVGRSQSLRGPTAAPALRRAGSALLLALVGSTSSHACGGELGARADSRGATESTASGENATELTVYAATSLRDALAELVPEIEVELGVELVLAFGSSGDLARQIAAGAPADVFLSADELEMDRLDALGLLEPGTRRALLSNQLVVIEPIDPASPAATVFRDPFDAEELAGHAIERLSLANPATVPAGRYAKAWLTSRGAWEAVAERVLPGIDVRAALAAVESGGAQAGIVYRTDAARSQRVRVVFAVPADEGPPISYPVAAVRRSSAAASVLPEPPGASTEAARGARPTAAEELLALLAGSSAKEVFERHGFVRLDE